MITTTQDKEFKEQLKKDFIPFVQRLIRKEEEHLDFLKKSREKFLKDAGRSVFFDLELSADEVGAMITYSKTYIAYLKFREKQYIEYAKKI